MLAVEESLPFFRENDVAIPATFAAPDHEYVGLGIAIGDLCLISPP